MDTAERWRTTVQYVSWIIRALIRRTAAARQEHTQQRTWYDEADFGLLSRWLWRHDETLRFQPFVLTSLIRLRLNHFPTMERLTKWKMVVPPDTRCVLCDTGEVETIAHFLVTCPALAHIRPQEVRDAIRALAERGLTVAQSASVLVGGTVGQTDGDEINWPRLAVVLGIDQPRQEGVETYAQPKAQWPGVWLRWIENMVRTRYRLVGQARRVARIPEMAVPLQQQQQQQERASPRRGRPSHPLTLSMRVECQWPRGTGQLGGAEPTPKRPQTKHLQQLHKVPTTTILQKHTTNTVLLVWGEGECPRRL